MSELSEGGYLGAVVCWVWFALVGAAQSGERSGLEENILLLLFVGLLLFFLCCGTFCACVCVCFFSLKKKRYFSPGNCIPPCVIIVIACTVYVVMRFESLVEPTHIKHSKISMAWFCLLVSEISVKLPKHALSYFVYNR